MEAWTRRAFLIACAATFARASPALTAEPVVTPAALLPRVDSQILGWYSSATVEDGTLYTPWAYDADQTTYTTSGDWFRRCAVSSSCTMYTGCSNGYMMAEGTSSSCGAGGSSGALFCSYHVLRTSVSVTSGERSWYWCDEAPLTGVTFYEDEPSQPNTSSLPSSTVATTTRTIAGGDSSSRSSTPSPSGSASSPTASGSTPPPSEGGSSTNVGAIAGGVVGGVVGLALIGAGVFFLMYRKKKNAAASSTVPTGYAPPPNQPGYPASPNMPFATAYQANEAKPVGVQEGGFYPPPAPYPQGPYDPHMSYAGSPPPQEAPGVQPHLATAQAMPQEMPASK